MKSFCCFSVLARLGRNKYGTAVLVVFLLFMWNGIKAVAVPRYDRLSALEDIPRFPDLTFSQADTTAGEKQTSLDEVVVTGYSTQRKASITGAVGVVNVNDVRKMPDGNVLTALQGRVAGVQIGKTGGPGGENTVRIRGYSNVSTNDPLYIIDGIPTQDGGIFNAINPADIETMQVLKDAASAAIYGSRANNGVIIITTKSGAKAKGKTEVNVDYYTGIQTVRKETFPQFLNPQEYGDWLWARAKQAGKTPPGEVFGSGATPVVPNYVTTGGAFQDRASAGTYDIASNSIKQVNKSGTDWLDAIMRTSMYHSANVSVAKSMDRSNFYFSAGYYKNDGIIKYTGFERLSVRMNASFKATDFITIGENFTIAYSTLSGDPVNQNETGPIFMAMRINPLLPVYDVAGNFGGTAGKSLGNAHNPLALLYRNRDDYTKTLNVLGNVYARLDFSKWVEGLGAEMRFNIDYKGANMTDYTGISLERSEPQIQSVFREGNAYGINQTYTGLITYNRAFGKHQVTGLGGVEYIYQTYRTFNATRYGFVSDDINFRYLGAGGPSGQLNDGNGNQVSLFSLFFKGDYAYNQKYFFTVILRNDESSRFAKGNRSRLFPSFGVAWKISGEKFAQNWNWLDNLKVRASWGQTGNQSTSLPYPTYTLYTLHSRNNDYDISASSSNANVGLSIYQAGNPNLRWEVVTSTDVGFEIEVLKGKLALEGNYYYKKTNDMLVQVPRPGVKGISLNPWENVGTMLNEGVEFTLTHSNKFQNGFYYSASLNFSRNINTVVKLMDNQHAFIPGRQFRANTITRISQGQPISYFYGYVIDNDHPFYTNDAEVQQLGQSQAVVGGFRYKDINGDGKITPDDRTNIGSPLPAFIYGLNVAVGFKKLELSFFLEGSQGNKIFNQARYFTDFDNFTAGALNRRVLQSYGNVNRPIVPLNSEHVSANSQSLASTYFVEDGSFLRMRNIRLSYAFGGRWLNAVGIKKLMLYVQVENAFIITKYTGLDPEINVQGVNANLNDVSATVDTNDKNYNLGIDQGAYPNPRSYVFGLSVTF